MDLLRHPVWWHTMFSHLSEWQARCTMPVCAADAGVAHSNAFAVERFLVRKPESEGEGAAIRGLTRHLRANRRDASLENLTVAHHAVTIPRTAGAKVNATYESFQGTLKTAPLFAMP